MRLLSFCLCVVSWTVSAETIWVAQTSQGGDTGADAVNAHSAAWFNTAANWGAGAGLISPGDTVMLMGTISTALTVRGSGAPSSPIRIQFDDGAKISAPTWGTEGALSANSKRYIDVVGGTIESTDNGGGLTYQNNDRHICLSYCTDWNISGLASRNSYVANQSAPDTNAFGNGLYALGVSSLNVSNCVFANGGKIVMIAYQAGNSNVSIINSSVSNCIVGITVGSGGAGATIDGVRIQGNTVNIGTNWWGSWVEGTSAVWHHTDCLHLYPAHTSSWMKNVSVTGNALGSENPSYDAGGNPTSNGTAWLYIAGGPGVIYSPLIANNLFSVASGLRYGPSVGILVLRGCTNALVANNTIVGNGARNGIYLYSDAASSALLNNVIVNCSIGVFDSGSAAPSYDYNCYYGNAYVGRRVSSYKSTLSDWQTGLGGCPGNGVDCASLANNPEFVSQSDFRLRPGSSCVGAGTNLSAFFATDALGRIRSSSWDVGAYQSSAGTSGVPPARPTGLVLVPH